MRKDFFAFVSLGFCALAQLAFSAEPATYTSSGDLVFPSDYRAWVFLTSSLDLNYNEAVPGAASPSLFDNVFVNPEAYWGFLKAGIWPDRTVIVKENRTAVSAGSIAKSGKFQAGVASAELHVKDEARFPGKWAFFVSDGKSSGRLMPPSAACYSCHLEHGATDTTFVQLYPTLIEVEKPRVYSMHQSSFVACAAGFTQVDNEERAVGTTPPAAAAVVSHLTARGTLAIVMGTTGLLADIAGSERMRNASVGRKARDAFVVYE